MTMDNPKHEAWAETAMIIVESCRSTDPKIWSDFVFINYAKENEGVAQARTWIYNELAPFIDDLFWKYYPDGGPAFDIEFVPFILSLLDEYWRNTTLHYINDTLKIDQLTKDKFNFLYAETILSEWNDQ